MLALLQRVVSAKVVVADECIGGIGPGLLVFLCAQPRDSTTVADKFLERILNYRLFADDAGKMNKSVRDVAGGVLLVPQFTLAADTKSGLRPSFTQAASPDLGRQLFDHSWDRLQQLHQPAARGRFGAHMRVSLTNDGPATFWLSSD